MLWNVVSFVHRWGNFPSASLTRVTMLIRICMYALPELFVMTLLPMQSCLQDSFGRQCVLTSR